jgi:hypothetical protein
MAESQGDVRKELATLLMLFGRVRIMERLYEGENKKLLRRRNGTGVSDVEQFVWDFDQRGVADFDIRSCTPPLLERLLTHEHLEKMSRGSRKRPQDRR